LLVEEILQALMVTSSVSVANSGMPFQHKGGNAFMMQLIFFKRG